MGAITFVANVIGSHEKESMMLKKKDGIWKLMSKSDPTKVLKNFGKEKPSDEEVAKQERRIQFFKHGGALNKGGK